MGAQSINIRRRGQPVVAMGVLLLLWITVRSILWESPFSDRMSSIIDPAKLADAIPSQQDAFVQTENSQVGTHSTADHVKGSMTIAPLVQARAWRNALGQPPSTSRLDRAVRLSDQVPPSTAMGRAAPTDNPMPLPNLRRSASPAPVEITQLDPPSRQNRWSFDAWAFLRHGANANAGPRPSTYGASQAGGVLRYRLAQRSRNNPTAYVRISHALSGSRDTEAAIGGSVRPISAIPIAAYAELRANYVSGTAQIRPAAFAVTELPRVALPFGARVEAYAQAGYVGGDFATAFVDGQVRLDREIAQFDLGDVRLGAGAWGGAQQDASRLDVGPTASLDFELGETPARISVDYRQRINGDAEPQSGVAITLSTGF